MRKSALQLYAPFLVLALVQALLIAVAPSRGPGDDNLATGGTGFESDEGALGGTDVTGADGSVVEGGSGVDGTGSGSSGAGSGGSGTGAGGTGGSGGGGGGGGGTAGDTSHCTADGKQFGITRTGGPPCRAKWPAGADNGGATYQGVTADTIKVIIFEALPNEQVDTILGSQGLATTEQQRDAAYKAFFDFANKHYEFYGRKIVWKRIVGDCPTTPPDPDACIADASKVVKEKPFAVIWNTSLYASVFDVFAKKGVVSFGGQHFAKRFYTDRRPYRYDIFMDGTQSADMISEYFCKKLANKNASHSGARIHALIGNRNQVERKLAVVVPEIPANVENAKRVAAKTSACSGKETTYHTYESNIETATTQTQDTVNALIDARATTVVCMCDPIAPAFLTKGMTGNTYFPEFMLPGLGLLDYDLLGRLYDTEQMRHAFGPSHLGLNLALDETDQARVWRTQGNSGHPCGENGCGLNWAYVSLLSSAVHLAGPNLNPLTIEKGLLQDSRDAGGTPEAPLVRFGAGDYTSLSDAKEVYWSTTARSRVDGDTGAYIPMNSGRRYTLGAWTSQFTIPVEPR